MTATLACGTAAPGSAGGPTISGRMTESPAGALESADVLRRTRVHQPVHVKHVLIGWGELEGEYGGRMSAEAKGRDRFDAERLVRKLVADLGNGAPIEPMMIEHSGDPGSSDGRALRVTTSSKFVPRFIALSTRLETGEVGVVRTAYGYHVIKRVK